MPLYEFYQSLYELLSMAKSAPIEKQGKSDPNKSG